MNSQRCLGADCKRQVPQYVGYGPPPAVVIAVLCLVVTLTCCCCGIVAICSVFLRRKKRTRSLADDDAAAAAVALLKKKATQKKAKKAKRWGLFVLPDGCGCSSLTCSHGGGDHTAAMWARSSRSRRRSRCSRTATSMR